MSTPAPARPRHILPVIVLAQFAGTSLWFAGNAVLPDLRSEWGLGDGALGALTSSVQLGFIVGTLIFAALNIADRFPPRLVFLLSALFGAAANGAIALGVDGMPALIALRFLVGLSLAGIYPVGMKIAASWYAEGLGNALGFLVGALVLGTAFPHVLRAGGGHLAWRTVIVSISVTGALGGVLLYALVPAGPHLPAKSAFDPRALARIFREPKFRAAAVGYFGHMWELYAFWAFVPVLLAVLVRHRAGATLDVSLWSFVVIAVGAIGCAVGGAVSKRWGSARVAAMQITLSGALCLASPLLFRVPLPMALACVLVWGVTVVGDSPQFSALTAMTAPRALVGTALTIVTCLGFLLTIPSIQLMTWLVAHVGAENAFLALAPGPVLGRLALRALLRDANAPASA